MNDMASASGLSMSPNLEADCRHWPIVGWDDCPEHHSIIWFSVHTSRLTLLGGCRRPRKCL